MSDSQPFVMHLHLATLQAHITPRNLSVSARQVFLYYFHTSLGIRLSGIRLSGIRLSGIRESGARIFYIATCL